MIIPAHWNKNCKVHLKFFRLLAVKKVQTELYDAQKCFRDYFLTAKLATFLLKTCIIGNLVLKQFVNFAAKCTGAEDLDCLDLAKKFLVWAALVAFG